MKLWYHRVFQLSFGILILQNTLILLSFLLTNIELTLPYYIDLIGYGLLGLNSLVYYIREKNTSGIISSLSLVLWVGIRSYFQFVVVETFSFNPQNPNLFNQLEVLFEQASLFLLLSGLLLLNYAILMQFCGKSNLTMLLIFGLINLIASFMIFISFYFGKGSLEEQLNASMLGLSLKLILVPILGIFTFSVMSSKADRIYPSTSD